VNLGRLSRLRVFALYAFIKCDTPGSTVLRDINIVLGTIPASNTVTNLSFDITILGKHPFRGCLDGDWVGICDEVIRISSGKPLELDLTMVVDTGKLDRGYGENNLYVKIRRRTTSLSDHPQICTHFWNLLVGLMDMVHSRVVKSAVDVRWCAMGRSVILRAYVCWV
jgi:hypothetical protein